MSHSDRRLHELSLLRVWLILTIIWQRLPKPESLPATLFLFFFFFRLRGLLDGGWGWTGAAIAEGNIFEMGEEVAPSNWSISEAPVSMRRLPSKLLKTKSSRIKLSNSASDPPSKSNGKLPKEDNGSIGGGTFKFVAWLGLTPFSSNKRSRFRS